MFVLKFRRVNAKGRVFIAHVAQREQVTVTLIEGAVTNEPLACSDMQQAMETVLDFFTRHQAQFKEPS